MTIEEKIVKEIVTLRECFDDYREAENKLKAAQRNYEIKKAQAGIYVKQGFYFEPDGEQIFLSNDLARKAFTDDYIITELNAYNDAKSDKEVSKQRIEIERSVLSALKQLAGDENFDRDILGRYDI